jgi:aryl sulfotransferase
MVWTGFARNRRVSVSLPNVMMLHFTDMKAGLPGQIRRVAEFLDTPIDQAKWPAILEHCSFDYMKATATASVPLGGAFWDGGAQTFVHKGINGRWRDELSAEHSQAYVAGIHRGRSKVS